MLGIGLGGFVDGILLHQIIHWHNLFLSIGGAGFILLGRFLYRRPEY